MSLPKGFRIKEDLLVMSDETGIVWRVMVAGNHYVQLRSETMSSVSMRVPTEALRMSFSQVIEVH